MTRSISVRSLGMFLVPVVLAVTGVSLFGYQGLNGQDSHDYLRLARGWTAWAAGAPAPHMIEHPHGYPMAGAVVGGAFGAELFAMRLICALSLVVLAVTVRNVLRRMHGAMPSLDGFILLTIVCSPFLLRYSMIVLSDMPAIALMMLTYAATVRWCSGDGWRWLLAAALAGVLALSVRLAVVPVIGMLALACVHGPPAGRRVRWWIAGTVLVLVIAFVMVRVPMIDLQAIWKRSPMGDWSLLHYFQRTMTSDDGVLHYTLPNILYITSIVLHPGSITTGILLLPFFRKEDLASSQAKLTLALLLGYLLFIAGMPFQNYRILVMAQPFAVMLLFPSFKRAVDRVAIRRYKPSHWLVAIAVLQVLLFVRAMVPFVEQASMERDLVAKVCERHPRHVYTHGMGAAINTYCPGAEVTELWYGLVDRFEPGSVIVVQPVNMQEQWEGRAPALNWNTAQEQGLEELETRENGWVIARVR